jgi:hypothetical protein
MTKADLKNKLFATLKEKPEDLFTVFRKSLDENPSLKDSCHGVAHELGHASYAQYGFGTSMHRSGAICGGGYIHGLIESKFGELGEAKALKSIKTICPEKDQSCNHGIGHGLMVMTVNNINKSLQYCDSLGKLARSDCYDGVFMHVYDNEETGISKNIKERAEGGKLCEGLNAKYQTSCYFYLPRLVARHQFEEKSAELLCSDVTNLAHHRACVFGSGVMFMKYHLSYPELAVSMCGAFGAEKSICIDGTKSYKDFAFK